MTLSELKAKLQTVTGLEKIRIANQIFELAEQGKNTSIDNNDILFLQEIIDGKIEPLESDEAFSRLEEIAQKEETHPLLKQAVQVVEEALDELTADIA